MEQGQSLPGNELVSLSVLVVTLLKGVIYREREPRLWSGLLNLQTQVRDYVLVLGLDLMLDDTEGYAFLRSHPMDAGEEEAVPRLVARRPLTFYDSLLLALLRKKLAEFDATGTETRLIMNGDDIQELIQLFLPERSDQVKLATQIEKSVQRLQDMGFLRKLKSSSELQPYEVQRILKSFVDAQWLRELDDRLAEYKMHLTGEKHEGDVHGTL